MNKLRKTINLLLIVITVNSCTQNSGQVPGAASADSANSDRNAVDRDLSENTVNTDLYEDTTLHPSFFYLEPARLDSVRRDLKLQPISQQEFDQYAHGKSDADADSTVFLKSHGLSFSYSASDIMESYLVENKTQKKLLLPSSYDEGIIGLRFSPSGDQFIVYSSYDSPGYKEYYEHRSEAYIFSIAKNAGIKGIHSRLTYYSDDWSIDKVRWINEDSVVFKVFKEESFLGQPFNYNYFKAALH